MTLHTYSPLWFEPGGEQPTRFEMAQGNRLLKHPFILCVCWDAPLQSNNTFIDSNLCTFPCRSVIQEALYSSTFIYPSALSVSIPSLLLRCHCLSQEPPSFNPCWSPRNPRTFGTAALTHSRCQSTLRREDPLLRIKLFFFKQSYLLFCSTTNKITEQNICKI